MKKRIPMQQKYMAYKAEKLIFVLAMILCVITLFLLSSCQPDGPLEEALEDVIEDYTGIPVDLSADEDEAD
jgi:hypothetical protein